MALRSLTARPDFLVLGAPKAGTTWCHDFFAANDAFYVPAAKDTFFFDRHYDRGADWYETHFRSAKGEQRVGEVCHDYLYSSIALDRIEDFFDEALTPIVILREPVQRSISHLRYSHQLGNVDSLDSAALEANPNIVELSRYDRYLPEVIDRFGDRLRVLFFEDLRRDAEGFASALSEAVGSGAAGPVIVPGKSNGAGRARSRSLARLGVRVATGLDAVGARSVVGRLKGSPLRRAFFDTSAKPEVDTKVASTLEAQLSESRERTVAQLIESGCCPQVAIPKEWL